MLPFVMMIATAHAWVIKTSADGDELHWDVDTIPYQIDPLGDTNLSEDAVLDMVTVASDQWSAVPDVNLSLEYQGTSNLAQVSYEDGVNLVFFEDDWTESESLLAVTYVWSVETGRIVAFDMAINSQDYVWATDGALDANDLMNTTVHEFGHAVGFDHSTLSDATMFGTTYQGELSKRDLSADDEDGLRYLYAGGAAWTEAAVCGVAPIARQGVVFLAIFSGALIALRRRSDP